MARKTGKPKELEENLADDERDPESFLNWARDFLPEGASQPQNGYPSLKWLEDNFNTQSAAIRYLYNLDPRLERVKDIAKHLDTRYQHVRNVVTTKLKRGANEDWTKPYHPKPEPNHITDEDEET